MHSRLSALRHNAFFKHNVIFFVGSFLVAFINYLFHPVMSRLLTVEEFGEVQVLFSILVQVGIPLSIFNIIAVNLYTNQHRPDSPAIKESALLMAYVAGSLALLLLLTAPLITSALSLSSPLFVVVIAVTIIVSSLSIFGRSALQAQHRFGLVSLSHAINAGGKLLFAVLLVVAGFGVLGAVAGFFIAMLLSFLFIRYSARDFLALPYPARLRFTPTLRHELRFTLIILAGTGFITFMTTADIIFAKYFFDAETAGLYAGISVVGRIIFFATASIAGVLLAHVKQDAPAKANQRIVSQGLFFTLLLGGSGVLLLSVFPDFIVRLLVGEAYSAYSSLLPLLAVSILLMSLVNICISYAIALRDTAVIAIGVCGTLVTIGLALTLSPTPENLIKAFFSGSVVALLLSLYTIFVRRSDSNPSSHASHIHPIETTY